MYGYVHVLTLDNTTIFSHSHFLLNLVCLNEYAGAPRAGWRLIGAMYGVHNTTVTSHISFPTPTTDTWAHDLGDVIWGTVTCEVRLG